MASDARNRSRMIFDLPAEAQLAIRLRALKSSQSTADIVYQAVEGMFGPDLQEAKTILAEQNQQPKPAGRKR